VQVKDPRNNLYGYSYDALQRLIHTMDQAGGEVTVTRNAEDVITSYKDDRFITTTYVRNGFGEVIQEVSPDAGTTTYVRDERGLVTSETDGRGIVTNRSYDAAGRTLTETYPAATTENVTYTYDNIQKSKNLPDLSQVVCSYALWIVIFKKLTQSFVLNS
jgi:YD repeat-containing protein